MNLINFTAPVTGNFLVDIIKWLIQISSSIAVGVILFTVILKLITLPFDFFSRKSMRKNSLKMEAMRPELEKLQKQYANDKALYQQKMMALYKKNGYSMWGSCLPTLITLAIFIVAINAFTFYSNYQNQEYFYDMSKSYNAVIYEGLERDDDFITLSDGNIYKIDYKGLYEAYNETPVSEPEVVAEKPFDKKDTLSDDETIKTVTKTYEVIRKVGTCTLDKNSNIILDNYKITERKSIQTFEKQGNNFVETSAEIFNDPSLDEFNNRYQMSIKTENGYIEHFFNYTLKGDEQTFELGSAEIFTIIDGSLTASNTVRNEKNNNLKLGEITFDGYYAYKQAEYVTAFNKTIDDNAEITDKATYKIALDNDGNVTNENPNNATAIDKMQTDLAKETTADKFLTEICQVKSAETFRGINKQFLWVKNIWVTDSPLARSVPNTWTDFTNTYNYNGGIKDQMDEFDYDNLIAKLDVERTAPNGYFILAILTAGISFLTQFVMSKSQKSQMELQTVDGQGAKTQKIMMWIMPIMMAVFAFMYTAAFSIYMIISSVFSILTTLGINWIVDVTYVKKMKKNNNDDTIRGRVHDENVQDPKKLAREKRKAEKKAQQEAKAKKEKKEGVKNDFINSNTDKHIRGRLK